MLRRFFAYLLILFGVLCFLIAGGGGSMRMRNRSPIYHNSIYDGLIIAAFIIALPILGFFSIKYGMKLLNKKGAI